MAEQVFKRLIDDLDGSEAEETVSFAIDGIVYEIDLSAENAGILRDRLSPFMENGRRAGGGGVRRPRGRAASSRQRSADIRAWAKAHGIEVSKRGRIPATVVEEYERAH
ncbi:histone-like nucleoid-structuring protein Lsr2 [Actinoallomurus rhizosphaericola]|uniref:histone-like nucleoid-structuring protein Lsr2 n=1 Tax=Actinoallomurus rhizosphaericola TaxID=2952536 RepID=UPI00209374C9|nr:Lsr2 family protein [Actinoallomurus rhizosphaericola]MCO5999808.1 Lsr2 family protein [Actinoallomurus rhizosphaericola]